MLKKPILFTPGPTPIPPEVSLAEAAPMIHHRTPEFSRIIAELKDDLKYLFQTQEGEVYTFSSSGTGAMEACVANLLTKKDKVLVLLGGKFAERWVELCEAYGVKTATVDVKYGEAVGPEAVEEALKKNKDIKVVFATQCETSTGVLHDIESIAKVVKKHSALLVVDAITGVGVHPLLMDAWGVDVAVTGSQKGCMIPPGIALLAVRPTAWEAIEKADLPRYYWDLRKMRDTLKKDTTPFTPAISLIRALKVAIDMIKQEGLENVWQRHAHMAHATREAIKALGLELYAQRPCNILTAVKAPKGLDVEAFLKRLKNEYGIWFAEGQEEMKGKIFRIAHVGYMNDFDILTAVSAVERGLYEAGYPVEIGKGVATAQKCLLKGAVTQETKKKPVPAPL
ncbi:MAG TPA: pyridoxal-phosphate-dependent aminotransferase family protein [Candidatus Tripitaka sp. YC43]